MSLSMMQDVFIYPLLDTYCAELTLCQDYTHSLLTFIIPQCGIWNCVQVDLPQHLHQGILASLPLLQDFIINVLNISIAHIHYCICLMLILYQGPLINRNRFYLILCHKHASLMMSSLLEIVKMCSIHDTTYIICSYSVMWLCTQTFSLVLSLPSLSA